MDFWNKIWNKNSKIYKNKYYEILFQKRFELNKFSKRATVLIVGLVFVIPTMVYGGIEYAEISEEIKEIEEMKAEEKYDQAIKKTNSIQSNWLVENLGIKKDEISKKQEDLIELKKEFNKYNEALSELNNANYTKSVDLLSKISNESPYFNKAKIKIEIAKRKMTEEELDQVKVAKKQAEEKARIESQRRINEEKERKIVEQELTEKKKEEEKMNSDNDGDGLTYREESNMGTSDEDKDSDNDGIEDIDDAHPAGGGRYQAQAFSWSYGGYNWTWNEQIHEDWYEYYKNKKRTDHGIHYVTSEDPFVLEVANKIKNVTENKSLTKSSVALSFVQSLSWINDLYTGYDEYPKYPIETFFEKNGDCEDSSYLLVSILDAMNIGSTLLILPGHMAVGVWVNCDYDGTHYKVGDRCYFYAETTSSGWGIGDAPPEYENKKAEVITVPHGESYNKYPLYNAPCELSTEFYGYYYSDGEYYSDSNCNVEATCIPYEDYYYDTDTEKIYHNSSCTKEYVEGCYKSSIYSSYYYDGYDWYYDHRCTQEADPSYY